MESKEGFKLLKMEDFDPIESRLRSCIEYIEDWELTEDYYPAAVYQKLLEAKFFWEKYLEEFEDLEWEQY